MRVTCAYHVACAKIACSDLKGSIHDWQLVSSTLWNQEIIRKTAESPSRPGGNYKATSHCWAHVQGFCGARSCPHFHPADIQPCKFYYTYGKLCSLALSKTSNIPHVRLGFYAIDGVSVHLNIAMLCHQALRNLR